MEIDQSCGTSCKNDHQTEHSNGAFCAADNAVSVDGQAAKDEKAIDPDCGFTQKAGEKCSVLIKEGARLCDKSCTKLVSSSVILTCQPILC